MTEKDKNFIAEMGAKIINVENRLNAGRDVLIQCRQQIFNLKKLLKEYKQLKAKFESHVSTSAADGDL